MEKIMKLEIANAISHRATDEIVSKLIDQESSILFKTHAAIHLGNKLEELGYSEYSDLLLGQLNIESHFEIVRLGVKPAWTLAIVLAENLKEEDYPKLRQEFNKWDSDERDGLLNWIKDFPEQTLILTNAD
ncbi:MAG: hypothetical protein GQ574_25375 [Crocinitomix sp.]|nr:hypothetical protein [Crocinitomix sp.]